MNGLMKMPNEVHSNEFTDIFGLTTELQNFQLLWFLHSTVGSLRTYLRLSIKYIILKFLDSQQAHLKCSQ